jgi:protein-tyrosine-phosphatase
MSEAAFNVLFLCTGNSARSILAESMLNSLGNGRFRAWSAGSHPAGRVNPFVLELLEKSHFLTAELRSKAWDEFAQSGAARLDFVFTLCDKAAGEVCPVWPGQPVTAHWGIPDPAAANGTDDEKRHAVVEAMKQLQRRISMFVSLPFATLDKVRLQQAVAAIGRSS